MNGYNDPFGPLTYERVTVEQVPLHVSRAESDAQYTLRHKQAGMREVLVHELRAHLHGIGKERIKVHRRWPSDWVEALKERWLPKWVLSRWPVKYESVDIDRLVFAAVCPHLQADPQERHVSFMYHANKGVSR